METRQRAPGATPTRAALAASILLLLCGAAGPPPPAVSPSTAQESALLAGQIFERARRLKEAEAEYRKALGSLSPAVRTEALKSLRRVVQARENWPEKLVASSRSQVQRAIEGLVVPLGIAFLLSGGYGLVRLFRALGRRPGRLPVR